MAMLIVRDVNARDQAVNPEHVIRIYPGVDDGVTQRPLSAVIHSEDYSVIVTSRDAYIRVPGLTVLQLATQIDRARQRTRASRLSVAEVVQDGSTEDEPFHPVAEGRRRPDSD
jgi:hypothetical protein